jgi:iron(III) transport system ATP-binding protein
MLEVRDLYLSYKSEGSTGAVPAVKGVSFRLSKGEFYSLLGPSGCGKTSTLRSVAGLETPDSGEIFIGDELVYSSTNKIAVPPNRRNCGIVFQSYAIWPHMSVLENVSLPLSHGRRRVPKALARERAANALSLVQLEHLAERPAPYLSGGQQQRVALARALALEPQLLLLDEPLSNLDARLREELRAEMKELVLRTAVTTLYVTHDQLESLAMSDRLAVMQNGTIVQEGVPEQVYRRPNSRYVAQFLGKANLLEGAVFARANPESAVVETSAGKLCCSGSHGEHGGKVSVFFRPESVLLCEHRLEGKDNVLEAEVKSTTFLGETSEVVLKIGGAVLTAKLQANVRLTRGQRLYAEIPPAQCVILE